ncbi:MAG: T9SS type A sorting domain-containing protein [Saprospiraceae bacterium]|nr:T9SS type A sorting domain-containing protein [Saprospiraceae bacterium]
MRPILLFIVLCVLSFEVSGQQATLLKNINPGSAGSFNFDTDIPAIVYKDKLYFVAKNAESGVELWVYDGTNTELFMDINPGSKSADVDFMFIIKDKLLFAADDGVHGYEWWETDGTTANTKLLIDLLPGSASGLSKCCYSYSSRFFHVFKNELYFNGNVPNNGIRFYKTDGTAAGTVQLAQLNHPQRSAEGFLEWKGNLYFKVYSEGLWKTDGTPAGTVLIKEYDFNPEFDPKYLTDMGDYILFSNAYNEDIWRTDGTKDGTVMVKKMFYSASQNNVGHYFFRYGNEAFFPGSNPANNTEMWKTNGTEAGTVQVSEIETDPGFIAFYPKRRVAFKNKIFYLGGKNGLGSQIYILDPATGNTKLLVDLKAKTGGEVYFQTDLIANQKFIFFVGGRAFDRELWYSDGSEAGTFEIKISPSDESTPERLTFYKDKLFFFANGNNTGHEPHVVDVTQLISSAKEENKIEFAHFPNPAQDYLLIESEKEPETAEIYDATGRLEATYIESGNLDIKTIQPGIKILKLKINNQFYFSRFIKL